VRKCRKKVTALVGTEGKGDPKSQGPSKQTTRAAASSKTNRWFKKGGESVAKAPNQRRKKEEGTYRTILVA